MGVLIESYKQASLKRLCVVSQNPAHHDSLRLVFGEEVHLQHCLNGADLLHALQGSDVQVALCDMNLSDVDALEFFRVVKKLYPSVSFVGIGTQRDERLLKLLRLEQNLDAILFRPLSKDVLHKTVMQFFSR
jgi:DNA-binding response OmpR family regulator